MLAREIERTGIPTVNINLIKTVAEKVKPPRAAVLQFPLGSPVGEPGNINQQVTVLRDILQLLTSATNPGTIAELPHRWKKGSYSNILKKDIDHT